MKLLITGSNGFVAGSILDQAPEHFELHGIARTPALSDMRRHTHHQLDLTEQEAVEQLIHSIQPDVVIHTAAIANIDLCESNRLLAEKMNVGVTRTIAAACAAFGAKLIFCSTDSVFDGRKGNYSERDLPTPINEYAETKIRGEQMVLEASKDNIVARLALVMGLPVIGAGNSFMHDTIVKLQAGQVCTFPAEEYRTPIDVITAGTALLELAQSEFHGIIHLAGNTCCSRLEMGREIARASGFPDELIMPAPAAMPGRARRAPNACLNNNLARSILKTPMLTVTEGIYRSLNYKVNRIQ